jgi:hypothetical protein
MSLTESKEHHMKNTRPFTAVILTTAIVPAPVAGTEAVVGKKHAHATAHKAHVTMRISYVVTHHATTPTPEDQRTPPSPPPRGGLRMLERCQLLVIAPSTLASSLSRSCGARAT